MPLVWGISSDPNVKKETKAAIQTFCEWMQMEPNAIEPLMKELGQMKEIKPFSINLKPTVITTKELQKDSNSTSQSASTERSTRRSSRSRQRNREKRSLGAVVPMPTFPAVVNVIKLVQEIGLDPLFGE